MITKLFDSSYNIYQHCEEPNVYEIFLGYHWDNKAVENYVHVKLNDLNQIAEMYFVIRYSGNSSMKQCLERGTFKQVQFAENNPTFRTVTIEEEYKANILFNKGLE